MNRNAVGNLTLALAPAVCAAVSAWCGLAAGVAAVAAALLAGLSGRLCKGLPAGTRLAVSLAAAAGTAALAGLLAEAFLPGVYEPIKAYLPLTALSGLLLAQSAPWQTNLTGAGGGTLLLLTAVGLLREFLGAGTLFGAAVLPEWMEPMGFLTGAPGAFLTAAVLLMCANALREEASA